jgi:hypothetical protein
LDEVIFDSSADPLQGGGDEEKVAASTARKRVVVTMAMAKGGGCWTMGADNGNWI